jgi:hypothetical protein
MAAEDDYLLTDEICQTDVEACNQRLNDLADEADHINSR